MPDRVPTPESTQYADPGTFSEEYIFVPAKNVVRTEMLAWRKQQEQAIAQHHVGMAAISTIVLKHLFEVGAGQLQAKSMKTGAKEIDKPFLHRWSMQAAGTIATASLVRHIIFEGEAAGLGNAEADIGVHFSHISPQNNRVFVHRRELASSLRIEPPLPADCWYEFNDVFTQVTTPATDIDNYGAKYRNSHDHPFAFDSYSSFTPFLKQEVWQAGQAPSGN